jgi:nucleoside-diphosphate-sugar epimerase
VNALVLGAGFTGSRVAALLARSGHVTVVTSRALVPPGEDPPGVERIRLDADEAGSREALAARLAIHPGTWCALVSFPPQRLADGSERVGALLRALERQLSRVVFLSSTTVYGPTRDVDAATPPAAEGERERLYLDAERAVLGGPWSALVLRAAAIYGPGRGILAEGGPRFAPGRSADATISRIHADDLAAVAAAGLAGELRGAFPVADEEPASARAVLAALAGEAPPAPADVEGSRRVDGRAVLGALGVTLRYRSFRDAIRANIAPCASRSSSAGPTGS